MWNPRRIGIDLDGVIIDHREHKQRLTAEHGIPLEPWQVNSNVIRQHVPADTLRLLQAAMYGPLTRKARPVAGALEQLADLKAEVYVVSSRRAETIRHAQDWLIMHRVYDIVPAERIYFCGSDEEKRGYCDRLGIDLFLDDKVSVLEALGGRTKRVLFDEDGIARHLGVEDRYSVVTDWTAFGKLVNGAA